MPTYEYECLSCGEVFEKFQNINDVPLESCPKCNQKVKRLLGTGGGFIFKGSGFYATDYRKGGANQGSSASQSCPMADKNKGCQGCNHKH
ncbi:MAG: FmdB family zinc ribbon protein [Candidatus Omnitrophota bacterium]